MSLLSVKVTLKYTEFAKIRTCMIVYCVNIEFSCFRVEYELVIFEDVLYVGCSLWCCLTVLPHTQRRFCHLAYSH